MKPPKPEELVQISYDPPAQGWMDKKTDFRPGTWSYPATADNLKYLDLPIRANGAPPMMIGSSPKIGRKSFSRGFASG